MEYYLNLWYDLLKKGINKDLIEEYQTIIMLGLEEDLKKLSKNYTKVKRFMSEIEEVNKNPEFRVYMAVEEDRRKIFNSLMKEAKEKNIKQGIEQRNIEIIKSMLKKVIPIEEISEIIGLSIEKIESIK